MIAKIQMEFELPEEEVPYQLWIQAPAYAQALDRLREELRQRHKYSEKGPEDWTDVYNLFWDIIKDEGVVLP